MTASASMSIRFLLRLLFVASLLELWACGNPRGESDETTAHTSPAAASPAAPSPTAAPTDVPSEGPSPQPAVAPPEPPGELQGDLQGEPQEKPPAGEQVGPPSPPSQEKPRTLQPQAVVTAPITDIVGYRGGHVMPIPRHQDRAALDLSRADFEAPVIAKVNGVPLTRGDFLRRATLLLGGSELDQYITYLLTKKRLDQVVQAGADRSTYTVSDAEVLKAIEERKAAMPQVSRQSGEDWEKQVREQFGWERYLEVERANLSFAKVFLPPVRVKKAAEEGGTEGVGEGVNELPAYTAELLDPQMAETLKKYYEEGTPIPYIFQATFVQQIRTTLLKKTPIAYYFEDELDPEWLLVIEGEPVKTEEIYSLLEANLKPGDLELALRDALVSMAVDQALDKEGFLISATEKEEAFKKHEAVYEGTFFPLQLVVSLKGFGSMHKYREYFGRKAGFEQLERSRHPGAAWEETLRGHFSSGPSRLFFDNGRIQADLIYLSAWDNAAQRLKEGGLAGAIERAAGIRREAEAGDSFPTLVSEYSELPNVERINKGRLGVKSRYEVRQALGENEYSIYADGGYCLADELFYAGVEGELVGPVARYFPERGQGALVARIDHFEQKAATRPFEEQKELVESDYLDLHFQMFVFDCVRQSTFEITRLP
ncbi:MAG: hypothetical protein AB1486_03360 [Planctomycetota bacterium]